VNWALHDVLISQRLIGNSETGARLHTYYIAAVQAAVCELELLYIGHPVVQPQSDRLYGWTDATRRRAVTLPDERTDEHGAITA